MGPTDPLRFLELTRTDRYGPTFLFLATTGCQQAEALGLRWADVDVEARVASLRQTVTVVAHKRASGRVRANPPRCA